MHLAIRQKAEELAYGACSNREISERISNFVRDQIYYSLDEWNVKPVEVLKKKRGMCAGKALLAAQLHLAMGIPARFKVLKILGEEGLFDFVKRQLEEGQFPYLSLEDRERLIQAIVSLPPGRDHIILQVLLDGQWVDQDIARDKELDYGMHVLGIWRERKILFEEGPFDSLDGWLEERMQRLAVPQAREVFFKVINVQIEKVRLTGIMALKSRATPEPTLR
jgi:transglutaminase-like putative cysteine protease